MPPPPLLLPLSMPAAGSTTIPSPVAAAPFEERWLCSASTSLLLLFLLPPIPWSSYRENHVYFFEDRAFFLASTKRISALFAAPFVSAPAVVVPSPTLRRPKSAGMPLFLLLLVAESWSPTPASSEYDAFRC